MEGGEKGRGFGGGFRQGDSARDAPELPLNWAVQMRREDIDLPFPFDEGVVSGERNEIGRGAMYMKDADSEDLDPAFELVDTVIAGRWRRRRFGNSNEFYFDPSGMRTSSRIKKAELQKEEGL